jgi:hypothetical protein
MGEELQDYDGYALIHGHDNAVAREYEQLAPLLVPFVASRKAEGGTVYNLTSEGRSELEGYEERNRSHLNSLITKEVLVMRLLKFFDAHPDPNNSVHEGSTLAQLRAQLLRETRGATVDLFS